MYRFIFPVFLLLASFSPIWASECSEEKAFQGARPRIAQILDMNVESFKKDILAQRELFSYALGGLELMRAICVELKRETDAECVSLLKADNFKSFIDRLIEKIEKKKYSKLKSMNDMVRARISLDSFEDMEKIRPILNAKAKQMGLTKIKTINPRRQFMAVGFPKCFYGYPRYHEVFVDRFGFPFEWQVSIKNLDKFFEIPGIAIPEGVSLPKHILPNIHDIVYRAFLNLLRRAKNDNEAEILIEKIGLIDHLTWVDIYAAIASLFGQKYSKHLLVKDLSEVHQQASAILEKIVRIKGPKYLNDLF